MIAATSDPINATIPPRTGPKQTAAAIVSSSSGTSRIPASTNAAIPIQRDDAATAIVSSVGEDFDATAVAAARTTAGRIHRRSGLPVLFASTAGTSDSITPKAAGSSGSAAALSTGDAGAVCSGT